MDVTDAIEEEAMFVVRLLMYVDNQPNVTEPSRVKAPFQDR
jgi:hypothetical protein